MIFVSNFNTTLLVSKSRIRWIKANRTRKAYFISQNVTNTIKPDRLSPPGSSLKKETAMPRLTNVKTGLSIAIFLFSLGM